MFLKLTQPCLEIMDRRWECKYERPIVGKRWEIFIKRIGEGQKEPTDTLNCVRHGGHLQDLELNETEDSFILSSMPISPGLLGITITINNQFIPTGCVQVHIASSEQEVPVVYQNKLRIRMDLLEEQVRNCFLSPFLFAFSHHHFRSSRKSVSSSLECKLLVTNLAVSGGPLCVWF